MTRENQFPEPVANPSVGLGTCALPIDGDGLSESLHADRGFYKALKEFRRVESEAPARVEAASDDPIAELPESRMGSFRAATPPVDRERALGFLDDSMVENPVVRGSDGLPLSITRPLPPPA